MKSAIKMSTKSLIREHKQLVKVLKKPTKKNLSKELKKQQKELKEYQE